LTEPVPAPDGEPEARARPPLIAAPKPPGADYGYVEHHAHASTREELIQRLEEGRPTPWVWTPETDGVVPPWTVPYLFEAYRGHGLRHARKVAVVWGIICAASFSMAIARGSLDFRSGFVIFAFVAAVLSFYSVLEWGRYRRLTPGRLSVQVREVRARPPARGGPARWTQIVAGAVGVVVLVQSIAAIKFGKHFPGSFPVLPGNPANVRSVEVAGMVKELVRDGEVWRLLTGAYLHDGLLHFGMNIMALLALGRFIEAYSHRAYVPLVFLLTALAASSASYAHVEASVGASGGIMGMFGFLALMARRRREVMPPGFGKAILIDIGVIAAMGFFGRGYIDNWAHAGGFLAGALLGWLMIPRGGRTAYWEPSRPIRRLGDTAMAILLLGSLGTIGMLVARLFLHVDWPPS